MMEAFLHKLRNSLGPVAVYILNFLPHFSMAFLLISPCEMTTCLLYLSPNASAISLTFSVKLGEQINTYSPFIKGLSSIKLSYSWGFSSKVGSRTEAVGILVISPIYRAPTASLTLIASYWFNKSMTFFLSLYVFMLNWAPILGA